MTPEERTILIALAVGGETSLEFRSLVLHQIHQAQREALERACRAECDQCRAGLPVHPHENGHYHTKGESWRGICKAKLIRALIDQESKEPPATQASSDNPSGEGV